MNELKPKKSKAMIVIIILLAVALLGTVSYLVFDKVLLSKEDNVSQENGSQEEAEKEEKDQSAIEEETDEENYHATFDSDQATNTTGTFYQLFVSIDGINVTLDTSKREVVFAYNPFLVNTRYSLGWVTTTDSYSYNSVTINNFTKDIEDIYLGGYGQDASNDTLFFLMEDGTVEYVPIRRALSINNEAISSYGALPSVSGVVKFYNVQARQASSGYATVLAQKANGTYYDLSQVLEATGNY